MIMYVADLIELRVKTAEVENATEHTVCLKGRSSRDRKVTKWMVYCNSRSQAYAHLKKHVQEEADRLSTKLDYMNSVIARVAEEAIAE